MIEPEVTDIGRIVIYRPPGQTSAESGVITAFNPDYVFVRYGRDSYSKATRRADLSYGGDVAASGSRQPSP